MCVSFILDGYWVVTIDVTKVVVTGFLICLHIEYAKFISFTV